jgi:hypothetical protein
MVLVRWFLVVLQQIICCKLNKVILFFFGFLIGAILMYALGDFFPRIVIQHTSINKSNDDSKDTITIIKEVKAASKREFVEELERIDEASGVNNDEDTLVLLDVKPDSIAGSSDYDVVRDRLLGKKTVIIQKSTLSMVNDTSAIDKISEKVTGNSFFNKSLMVEFWESPIDFLGYKLNKTTLVLYGISPQEPFELIDNGDGVLLFMMDDKRLSLMKTDKYKTLDI